MAGTISSIGVGTSGLDVSGIITKLVDLEKVPLTNLKATATTIASRITAYGQIKSLSSTLSDAALQLSLSTTWKAVSPASSDTTAVQVASTNSAIASPGSFSMQVTQLAKAQSVASSSFASSEAAGAGTLRIQLGTWNSGATAFTAGASSEVSVAVSATDTLADVASKLNAANAGVTATVISDGSGQRLMVRSSSTGESKGFRIQVDETTPDGNPDAGLSRLTFDPAGGAVGMASTANLASAQYGQDAKATINNVEVRSTSNTFTDTVPGLQLTVTRLTSQPVDISVTTDTSAMTKSVQSFVDAYNALNSFIAQNTTYDTEAKQATLLQGDQTAVGIQNMLRTLVGSITTGGSYQRLSEIGIAVQRDGSLAVDSTKLSGALASNLSGVANLFTSRSGTDQTNGFGVKLKAFMTGILSSTGSIATRTTALKTDQSQNTAAQDKVNLRATNLQDRLQKQYTALDTQMSQLSALNTYITQQITQWNKSTK